jgi:hypothetical protein
MPVRRAHVRSLAAIVLMAAVTVGSALHLWHHLTDPSCGTDGRHGAQPCATCSTLHSAAVATGVLNPAPPVLTRLACLTLPASERASGRLVLAGAPRAPPSA